MNSENIYDALTNIREEFIVEAGEYEFKKATPHGRAVPYAGGARIRSGRNTIMRWCAVAAAFLLAVGIGSYILFNNGAAPMPGGSTGGGGGGDTRHPDGSTIFRSYAGPVFPLSVLDGSEGITASRNIIFDFGGFGKTREDSGGALLNHSDIRISDDYILSNNSSSDKSITLLYPFAGSFQQLDKILPKITAGGNPLDLELLAGVYGGGFTGAGPDDGDMMLNLKPINTWDGYTALLSDGEYLNRALGNAPELDQTVTVYEFMNVWADHDKAVAPTLAASFNLDYERTTVLTYGFNGGSWDIENGFMRRSFFVPREGSSLYGGSFYMIVVGDDIDNLIIQGYKNGGCNKGEEMDGVTADVARYEAVLGNLLATLLDDFMAQYHRNNMDEPDAIGESLDTAMLYRAAAELLCDYGALSGNAAFRYDTGELNDIFSETLVMNRVFYLTAAIDIPAGESVALSAVMIKPGSYDFYGSGSENTGVYGYDMLTKLGSGMRFDNITAGITGCEGIDIVRQNFGFDLKSGIFNVSLNPETPHYFIEVSALNQFKD